jgi:predicted esterase
MRCNWRWFWRWNSRRDSLRPAALILLAFASLRPLQADPIPPYIGARTIPLDKPFEAASGAINFDLPFTDTWAADYVASRWGGKPPAYLAEMQADLAKLRIPVRASFPPGLDPGHRCPLILYNMTEVKDSRDLAVWWAGEAHAAGWATAGFHIVDGFQQSKWFDYGKHTPAICVYVASVLARHGPVDPNRIYVGGHSGGAKISTRYYTGFPADYQGVMVLGCNQFTPSDQGKDVMAVLQARGAAVFCGTGKQDTVASPASSADVFRSLQGMKFPYALNWDHEEGHNVPGVQLKKAFEFFDQSYADHYAKSEAATHRAALAHAKAKRYGAALFPLMKIASFKPDSDKAKEARSLLETIERDLADALAEADKLVGEKKVSSAKAALQKAAKQHQGSWHGLELQERARRAGR